MNRLIPLAVALILPSSALAQSDSTIAIHLKTSLRAAETILNTELPQVLHHNPGRREICVPAKRACTKIPEFRGLKIYSRMECIDVTPRISCNLSEKISRVGGMSLSGNGSRLTLTQHVEGSVTARGRGDIGKNIRQTVRAKARVSAQLDAGIAPNWSPTANVSISHQWTSRPTFKLFNLIDVSVGGEADSAINDAKSQLQAQLPAILANIGLREKMLDVWTTLQDPISIEIEGNTNPLFVHVRPENIYFSGLNMSGDTAQAALSVAGKTMLTDTQTSPWNTKSTLPNLAPQPITQREFDIGLPVQISDQRLTEFLASQFPIEYEIGRFGYAKFEIVGARLSIVNERLVIKTTLNLVKQNQTSTQQVKATLSAKLFYDKATQTVKFSDIVLEDGLTFATRALVRSLQFVGLLSDAVDVSISKAIAEAENQVETALSKPIARIIKPQAKVDIGIDAIDLKDASLLVNTRLIGTLSADVEF